MDIKFRFRSVLFVFILMFSFCAVLSDGEANDFSIKANNESSADQGKSVCDEFQKVWSDGRLNGEYLFRKLTMINGEDVEADIKKSSKMYTDGSSLYGLFALKKNGEQYIGLISYYPSLELLAFSERNNEKSKHKSLLYSPVLDEIRSIGDVEIEELVNKLEVIAPVSRKKEEKYEISKFDRKCFPLSGVSDGENFQDGKDRKFLVHYPFGKRVYNGRDEWLGCGEWKYNRAQLRFYENVGETVYKLGDKEVYVLGFGASTIDYASSQTYTEIPQICNLSDYVHYRIVQTDVKTDPSERHIDAKDYLSMIGLGGVEDKFSSDRQWELQVMRNILIGGALFYGKDFNQEKEN